MTNSTSTNPIFCDSTGALVSSSGCIKSIQFTNTGAGDKFTLLLIDSLAANASGKKIVQLEIVDSQPTFVITFPHPLRYHTGLYCQTIDGGEALIQV